MAAATTFEPVAWALPRPDDDLDAGFGAPPSHHHHHHRRHHSRGGKPGTSDAPVRHSVPKPPEDPERCHGGCPLADPSAQWDSLPVQGAADDGLGPRKERSRHGHRRHHDRTGSDPAAEDATERRRHRRHKDREPRGEHDTSAAPSDAETFNDTAGTRRGRHRRDRPPRGPGSRSRSRSVRRGSGSAESLDPMDLTMPLSGRARDARDAARRASESFTAGGLPPLNPRWHSTALPPVVGAASPGTSDGALPKMGMRSPAGCVAEGLSEAEPIPVPVSRHRRHRKHRTEPPSDL